MGRSVDVRRVVASVAAGALIAAGIGTVGLAPAEAAAPATQVRTAAAPFTNFTTTFTSASGEIDTYVVPNYLPDFNIKLTAVGANSTNIATNETAFGPSSPSQPSPSGLHPGDVLKIVVGAPATQPQMALLAGGKGGKGDLGYGDGANGSGGSGIFNTTTGKWLVVGGGAGGIGSKSSVIAANYETDPTIVNCAAGWSQAGTTNVSDGSDGTDGPSFTFTNGGGGGGGGCAGGAGGDSGSSLIVCAYTILNLDPEATVDNAYSAGVDTYATCAGSQAGAEGGSFGQVIQARQGTDSSWGEVTITVSGTVQNQTISRAPSSNTTIPAVASSLPVSDLFPSTSLLPVTAVVSPGSFEQCVVSPDGLTVFFYQLGKCELTLSQAGTPAFRAAADLVASVVVGATTQTHFYTSGFVDPNTGLPYVWSLQIPYTAVLMTVETSGGKGFSGDRMSTGALSNEGNIAPTPPKSQSATFVICPTCSNTKIQPYDILKIHLGRNGAYQDTNGKFHGGASGSKSLSAGRGGPGGGGSGLWNESQGMWLAIAGGGGGGGGPSSASDGWISPSGDGAPAGTCSSSPTGPSEGSGLFVGGDGGNAPNSSSSGGGGGGGGGCPGGGGGNSGGFIKSGGKGASGGSWCPETFAFTCSDDPVPTDSKGGTARVTFTLGSAQQIKFPAAFSDLPQYHVGDTWSPFGADAASGGTDDTAEVNLITYVVMPYSAKVCSFTGEAGGQVLHFDAPGGCDFVARQAAGGGFRASPPVRKSFSIDAATQSIDITSNAPEPGVSGVPYDVSLTPPVRGGSGVKPIVTVDGSSTTDVCTVETNPEMPAQVFSIAADRGVETFTTTSAHHLRVGQLVTIEGAPTPINNGSYRNNNGAFAITGVPSPTTFTIANASGAAQAPVANPTALTITEIESELTPNDISSIVVDGEQTTITTENNNSFTVGQFVTISDTGHRKDNGTFRIATKPSPDSFTIYNPYAENADTGLAAQLDDGTATVTVHTSTVHDLRDGDWIAISGAESGNNGTFKVLSRPTSNTFTALNTKGVKQGRVGTVTTGLTTAATAKFTVFFGSVAGDCVINANQDGNTYFSPAPQVQQTIAVKIAQAVSFTSLFRTNPSVGTMYQVTTDSGGGSVNAVTARVDADASVNRIDGVDHVTCSMNGTRLVTFLFPGPCVLIADQTGNADYLSAPQVTQRIQVVDTPVLTWSTPPPSSVSGLPIGAEYQPLAIGNTAGGPISYRVNEQTTNRACSTHPSAPVQIASISASASTATVTTSAVHGLTLGQSVTIEGAVNAVNNGRFIVASTPTTTTFTYSNASAAAQSAAIGTVSPDSGIVQMDHAGVCGISATQLGFDQLSMAFPVKQAVGEIKQIGANRSVVNGLDPYLNGDFFRVFPKAASASGGAVSYDASGINPNVCRLVTPAATGAAEPTWQIATIKADPADRPVVTVTTTATHSLTAGQLVTIAGAVADTNNGTFRVASTPTSTTFTIVNPSGVAQGPSQVVAIVKNNEFRATITTSAPHTLDPGVLVSIAGSTNPANDGTFEVATTPTATTFTIGNPSAVPQGAAAISSITFNSGVATVNTSTPHTLTQGASVTIVGAATTGNNGTFVVATVPTTKKFTISNSAGAAQAGVGGSARRNGATVNRTVGGTVTVATEPFYLIFASGPCDLTASSDETDDYAQVSNSYNLGVNLVPGAPTNVNYRWDSPTIAKVWWNVPPDASQSAGQNLTYTATASPSGRFCTTSGGPTCSVTGLNSSTSYTFSVVANNVEGDGPRSGTPNTGPFALMQQTRIYVEPTSYTTTGNPGDVMHPIGTTNTMTSGGDNAAATVRFVVDAESSAGACEVGASTPTVGDKVAGTADLSLTGGGLCVVDVYTTGGPSNYAAFSQIRVRVEKAAQTVSFTSPLPGSPVAGRNYVVVGDSYWPTTQSTGIGVTVTYSVSNSTPGACIVDPTSGAVNFLALGTCRIDANSTGSAKYLPALQVSQFVQVQGRSDIGWTSAAPTSAEVGGAPYVLTTSQTGNVFMPVVYSIDENSIPGVCAIRQVGAEYRVVFTGVGLCLVDANQDGVAGVYVAAEQIQQAINVVPAPPTVSFASSPPASNAVGTSYDLDATGSEDGPPVTYRVGSGTTASACRLDYSGQVVEFVNAGTCEIVAEQGPATDSETFTVVKGSQQIAVGAFNGSVPGVGDTYAPTLIAGESGIPVVLAVDASSDAGVCTAANTRSQNIASIAKASSTVTVNTSGAHGFGVGQTVTIASATNVGNNGSWTIQTVPTPTSFTITNAAGVAQPAAGGTATAGTRLVTFTDTGTCVLVFTQAGSSAYDAAAPVKQVIQVGRKGYVVLEFTSTAPTGVVVERGAYTPFARDVLPGGVSAADIVYSVNATPTGACIVTDGVVTFPHAGDCVVSAHQAASSAYYASDEATADPTQLITIDKAPQVVKFTSTPATTVAAGSTPYIATATGGGSGNEVVINSDNNVVCSIDHGTGAVTFKEAGTCTLRAFQLGNDDYFSSRFDADGAVPDPTQSITVTLATQVITFTSTNPVSVGVGDTYQVTATSTNPYPSGFAVDFTFDASSTSGACSFANVSDQLQGIVTFAKIGKCVINANQRAVAEFAVATQVQQVISIFPGTPEVTFTSVAPTNAKLGEGLTYRPTADGGPSNFPVSFSIDPDSSDVCVIRDGVVSYVGAGTCAVNAFEPAGRNWGAGTAQQSFTVAKGVQNITFAAVGTVNVPTRSSYYPLATGGASGQPVTFSVYAGDSTPGACQVTNNRVYLSGNAGDLCAIWADQAGDANYDPAQPEHFEQFIRIVAATQAVTFLTIKTQVVPGQTYRPSVAGNVSGGPVVVSIDPASTPGACSINAGVVTFGASGLCLLVASQAGATPIRGANFLSAKVYQSITVGVVAPSVARSVVASPRNKSVVVSWAAPASTGGVAISGYTVTASPKVGSVFKTCTAAAAQRSCTVLGLTNGKSYTFKVKAANAGGKSSTTAASAAVIAGAPTDPRSLGVVFPVAKSAKVTWRVPSSVGSGVVTGYRVRWCKVGGSCAAWVNLTASARAATVTGRVKNTNYRVELQAKNASGLGPIASKAFKQGK